MEFSEVVHTRRSIRAYSDQAVDEAMVERVLRAAMAAPSAGNQQPWHFVVIRDQATREASGTSVAFVWINSLTGLAGLLHSGQALPSMLPLWLGVVAVGALIGTQMGLKWLPVRGLRYALVVVLLIASGKLLFA